MIVSITKKQIKLTKDEFSVYMDFIDDIDESKIDWYIQDLTIQLETELNYHKSSELIKKDQNYLEPLSYTELRKVNYPQVEEQLDMLYWDLMNGTDKWRDKITEIKTKYPKPDLK